LFIFDADILDKLPKDDAHFYTWKSNIY
jgi:hypothetical protein